MKILKQGNLSKLHKYKKFECSDCGCIFLADQTEYINCSNQREGSMFRIECPCCKRNVWNYSEETVVLMEEQNNV